MSREQGAIAREIFIAAPPERVFNFLTDAQLMVQWLGSLQHLDPQPGGIFQVEVSPGNIAQGQYTEVVPFRRVAFTWGWNSLQPDPAALRPGMSLVEIELEPKNGGTRLRLRHSHLSAGLRPIHEERWSAFLNRLAITSSIKHARRDRRDPDWRRREAMDQKTDRRMEATSDEDEDSATDRDVQSFTTPSLRYADGFDEASVRCQVSPPKSAARSAGNLRPGARIFQDLIWRLNPARKSCRHGDRKAVARYADLTGSPDESGSRRRERGLARAGNVRVRNELRVQQQKGDFQV